MSISVDPGSRDRYASVVGAYLLSTVICALFGAVYELFSHEVYSYYMIYAFAFLKGILAIYGTSNPLIAVHWILGAALTSAGWTAMFLSARSVRADRG